MPTLTYLTGRATLGTASTTPALSGLVQGGTLIVTVKAAAESGSTLGNPAITDTLGTLTYDDTPNALTSTIAKDANPDDTTRQSLTAIYTATVGADVTGGVTATVSNADVVRVDAYFVDGTVTFNDTDIDDNGSLPIIPAVTGVAIDDWTVYVCAQSEYSIPSNFLADAGTTTTYGSLGDGTTSSVSTVLRWRDVIRTDTTDGDVEFYYESGGGWSHTGSALSFTITGAIGGGGGGTGGNTATTVIPGVGLLIEAALDGELPLAESHTWEDLTSDGVRFGTFRGRRSELVGSEPSRGSVDNITDDRSLDPDYAAGPYFGELLEMTPARISATYNSVTYRMLCGFVQAWPQQTVGGAADVAISTPLEIVDAASILTQIACPVSEYELRVLQDDPTVYYPLDDSLGGYTRDASDNDFAGALPTGMEQIAIAEHLGNGGTTGPYAATGGTATATNVHPDGDVDLPAVDFVIDVGVNRFPAYTGSGTETYDQQLFQLNTGLAAWTATVRRSYGETGASGRFHERTWVKVDWTDGTNDRSSDWYLLDRNYFNDPATASAAVEAARAAVATKEHEKAVRNADAARKAVVDAAFWERIALAFGGDNARETIRIADEARRAATAAQRAAEAARDASRAAKGAAAQSLAALATEDVPRDDFSKPVHIAARITTIAGPTTVMQLYVAGQLAVSATSGTVATTTSSGNVEVILSPRGVTVGHIAGYGSDLDPQSILEHHVCTKTGLGLQLTGERMAMVLKAAGWPDALTAVDAGSCYVHGPPSGSVESYLDELTVTEQGRRYVDGSGRIVFHDHMWDIQATEATVVQATLSDDLADTGSVWYSDIVTVPASQDTIINDVYAARDGGVPQRRYVPRRNRRATFSQAFSKLGLHSDHTVGEYAAFILRRRKDRVTRFTEVTIYPQHERQTDATVWPFVLGVQPGWRVEVHRTANDVGAAFEQECTVEGIEHSFNAGGVWTVRLYLVPAQTSADDAPWAVAGESLFAGRGTVVELDGGSANDKVSTPDPNPTLTTHLTVMARIAPDDWTPAVNNFIATDDNPSASNRDWVFWLNATTGTLRILWNGGGGEETATSTASPVAVDGQALWVRFTLSFNESGNHATRFYTAPSGESLPTSSDWVQLGSTVSAAGVASVKNDGTHLIIGNQPSNASPFLGHIHRVRFSTGSGQFADFDANDLADVSDTSTADSNGNTWTVGADAEVLVYPGAPIHF
jgi:hypothetical protein